MLTDAFFHSDGRLSSPGKHLLPPTLSRSEAFLCGYGYFPFYTDLRFVLHVRFFIYFETSWCYCSSCWIERGEKLRTRSCHHYCHALSHKLFCLYFSLSGLLTLSLSISQHSFNKGQRLHNEPESTPLSQTDSGQGSPAGNPSDPRTLPEGGTPPITIIVLRVIKHICISYVW